jgi:rare lipoprotein A
MLAIPVLALHHGSSSSASVHAQALAPASVTHDAFPRASRSRHRVLAAPADAAVIVPESTTPTTAPVATTEVTYKALVIHHRPAQTTTTTVKPKPKPAPKSTTTTTRPPSTTSGSSGSGTSTSSSEDPHYGKASWYEDAPAGTCAHKTLPKGTVVTVTDLDTGKSVQCTVADRGPYVDGYVIDLSKDTFEKLAPLSEGVVRARIDW